MLKALVIKELRESAGMVALAVLAAVFAVASLTGLQLLPIFLFAMFASVRMGSIPFVSDSFIFYLTLIAGGLAVVLGLKQSAWEFGHNTYHFLLHRPIRRASIFWVKLAVGCSLVLVLGTSMILVYATWAQAPGKSGTPFFWSMTASAWECLACLSLLYLAAFLCGIRPGRWFRTRLAPLVAGGAVALLIYSVPWWWLIPVAVAFAAYVMLVSIFYYAAQRDY